MPEGTLSQVVTLIYFSVCMCHFFAPYWGWYFIIMAVRMYLRRCKRRITGITSWWGLLYGTFCYNYFTTWMIMFETALEPMFWFVDRFARYLGPVSSNIYPQALLSPCFSDGDIVNASDCPSVFPSVHPSCYLLLNHWVVFNQTGYMTSPHGKSV